METSPRRSDAVLERLTALHPRLIDLSLDRTERLLAALGDPHRDLPPVIHVAGTNGKGSVVAFMRAIAEAAGLSVHTYTSPHLVRFHERIDLNGSPIAEDALVSILEECEAANGRLPITFFEITTVAAFVAFARTRADIVLLETGLGGRFDSTNVIADPAVTAITPISIDHTGFLGETLTEIAFEKAGILKSDVTCVVGPQQAEARSVIERRAAEVGAPLDVIGSDWSIDANADAMIFTDAHSRFELPRPSLHGDHQVANAGIAIAAMRRWRGAVFDRNPLAKALIATRWPGRFQRLATGRLVAGLRSGWELWVDGGHNPAAGAALAGTLTQKHSAGSTVLVCAMQANKDAAGFLAPLAEAADRLIAIDLPGETPGIPADDLRQAAQTAGLAADSASSMQEALGLAMAAGGTGRVLVCGSLYLAGAVLAANQPD